MPSDYLRDAERAERGELLRPRAVQLSRLRGRSRSGCRSATSGSKRSGRRSIGASTSRCSPSVMSPPGRSSSSCRPRRSASCASAAVKWQTTKRHDRPGCRARAERAWAHLLDARARTAPTSPLHPEPHHANGRRCRAGARVPTAENEQPPLASATPRQARLEQVPRRFRSSGVGCHRRSEGCCSASRPERRSLRLARRWLSTGTRAVTSTSSSTGPPSTRRRRRHGATSGRRLLRRDRRARLGRRLRICPLGDGHRHPATCGCSCSTRRT